MLKVIALDPGRTTGIAIASIDVEVCDIWYSQDKMDHKQLYEYLDEGAFDHIVCETFKFRHGKTGVDLYPCELIGIVNLWQQQGDWTQLWMQDPWVQSGKTVFFSDKKLKDMELYIKGIEHGRSAVKHLLYWLHFGAGSQYKGRQIRLR